MYAHSQLHDQQAAVQQPIYLAQIVNDRGKLIRTIKANNESKAISKATVLLEEQYPDAICKIKDACRNKTTLVLKKVHYLE